MTSFLTSIILLTILCHLYIPGTLGFGETSLSDKGVKYISYVGDIVGEYYPANAKALQCSSSEILVPSRNASLYLGVAGPWDTNPFYFQLYGHDLKSDLLGINFQSADLLCYENDGELCLFIEIGYGAQDWYFKAVPLLDLKRATIHNVTLGGVKGYQAIGSEISDISNGTEPNLAQLSWDTSCPHDGDHEFLYWSKTQPYFYNLVFNNDAANMNLTLNSSQGDLVLRYEGGRVDKGIINDSVILNTADPTKPVFTFLNGSSFSWHNTSQGYGVTATSMATSRLPLGNEKWTWGVLAIMVFAMLA